MLVFLEENLGTIVVAAIVLGSGILAVESIRRKSVYGCGGSCTGDCCGCLGRCGTSKKKRRSKIKR